MMINIIDVGLGNVKSVENYLHQCNFFYKRVSDFSQFSDDAIIIPGVASAGEYMHRLESCGLDKEIIKRSKLGQKIIGICLGFQIMSEFSEEDSGVKCLGLLDGVTKYIDSGKVHNGWESIKIDTREMDNSIIIQNRRKKNVKGRVYFNHELKVQLKPNSKIYSHTLENDITSFAFRDNIFGFQFHPEKSQRTGRELLRLIL